MKLNQQQQILLVANEIPKESFSSEELILACWKKYPRTFGLKGYEKQYPDSNSVSSSIMGKKGLYTTGLFKKISPKIYSITTIGKQTVIKILKQTEGNDEINKKLDVEIKSLEREDADTLKRMTKTRFWRLLIIESDDNKILYDDLENLLQLKSSCTYSDFINAKKNFSRLLKDIDDKDESEFIENISISHLKKLKIGVENAITKFDETWEYLKKKESK